MSSILDGNIRLRLTPLDNNLCARIWFYPPNSNNDKSKVWPIWIAGGQDTITQGERDQIETRLAEGRASVIEFQRVADACVFLQRLVEERRLAVSRVPVQATSREAVL